MRDRSSKKLFSERKTINNKKNEEARTILTYMCDICNNITKKLMFLKNEKFRLRCTLVSMCFSTVSLSLGHLMILKSVHDIKCFCT